MKVGVAGCGYWGKNHVRNFQQLGALAAVVDPSRAGRDLARQIAPSVQVFSDFQEFLKADIDGVVLATPAR